MTLEEEIFKKSEFVNSKLIEYGFKKENKLYTYSKNILNDSFQVNIIINNNKLSGKIMDKDLQEEYLNYRVENQIGEFAGTIRDEYIDILNDIKDKCCITKLFIFNQSNRIANIIREKYAINPEFIFDDKNIGVFRNKDNKKWFGIIMYIDYSKLDNKEGKVEVINVKLNPDKINNLIKLDGFYKAYHMNKKFWISITLNDMVDDSKIIDLINESYNYTVDTNEWIIPANASYFDVEDYINKNKIFTWKQTSSIHVGDIVYIYVGSPISAIICKTKAIKVNIKGNYFEKEMELERIKIYDKNKYTFSIVKEYDLRAIRGPRRMPKKLLDKMRDDEINEKRKD